MSKVAKRNGKEKWMQINFDGKACWTGVDVHKVSYAVTLLNDDSTAGVFHPGGAEKTTASALSY